MGKVKGRGRLQTKSKHKGPCKGTTPIHIQYNAFQRRAWRKGGKGKDSCEPWVYHGTQTVTYKVNLVDAWELKN